MLRALGFSDPRAIAAEFVQLVNNVPYYTMKPAVIFVIFVNALTLITSADDVVEGTGEVYSGSSRHERWLAQNV